MINKSAILYTAFLIMDLNCGARCNSSVGVEFQRQRSGRTEWLDWAINFTKRLPDNQKHRGQIFDYARGVGQETWHVRKYLNSIPEEAWEQGKIIEERA